MVRSRLTTLFLALITTLAVTAVPAHAAPTGGVIEGTLTTANGEPAAGARLMVKSAAGIPDYQLPTAVTDEAGHYRLAPLPAGPLKDAMMEVIDFTIQRVN